MTKITHQLGAVATAAGTLVAVGLLMLMVMVEAGPVGAAFPGKNGRIAYSSYDAPFPKGDLEIYTINARGGGGKSRVTNVFAYDLSWGIRP